MLLEWFSHRRFLSRVSEGCSDSKRHFFGDFLCASKESYPLLRRRSGSSFFLRLSAASTPASKESYPLLRRRSGSSALLRQSAASTGSKESYPLAEGQRKLWLQENN